MARFPKARSKNKSVSVFEQAHRFYGEAFEVTSSHDMADAMAEWGDLAPSERTFTLTHLLYLNLMAQAGTHLLLRKVWDAVEELADEMEDQGEHRGDGDHEDDEDEEGEGDPVDVEGEQEEEDLETDASDSVEAPALPPGVTIPAAVTPPVDEDEQGADQGDWQEPDDLDEGDEG